MYSWLSVALGAILGASCRHYLGVWLNPSHSSFALGVLVVNVLGCFLAGVVLSLNPSPSTKLFVMTGFLGSFTTFSAFGVDVVERLLTGKYLLGLSIILLHLLGGLIALMLGIWLGRLIK